MKWDEAMVWAHLAVVSVAGSVMLSIVLSRGFCVASKRVMPQKATEQHNAPFSGVSLPLAS